MVAILVGLETLVIPILIKLGGKEKEQAQELHLTYVDGNRYTNAAGYIYKVKTLDTTEVNTFLICQNKESIKRSRSVASILKNGLGIF